MTLKAGIGPGTSSTVNELILCSPLNPNSVPLEVSSRGVSAVTKKSGKNA